MRRTNMCHKINRNCDTNIYDINTNPVFLNILDPEFLESQNWQRCDEATGVNIIEIKDSDHSESSDETPRQNVSHPWCYVNNATQPLEEQVQYSINKKARDRRRLRADSPQSLHLDPNEYTNNNTIYFDNIDMSNHQSKNNARLNHQINCFTIINKHFVNSDTSSDNSDYYNNQKQSMGDTRIENEDYYSILEDEMLTYSSDFDSEKKTIWIYSFKNKHLLSDDCFELVNIPSKDTGSCTTFPFEKLEDRSNVTRAASPIPPPYIPRLDLSLGQTLSTVTEVTEPNKQSSLETERSNKGPVKQKPKNSWLLNKNKDSSESVDKQEKSTNVINWMALSPRERRRMFRGKQSDSDIVYKDKLGTLQEICSKDLKANIQDNCEIIETYKCSQSTVVDVDIHVGSQDSKEKLKCPNKDSAKFIPDDNILDVIEKDNSGKVMNDNVTLQEVNMCPRKPQININPKRLMNIRSVSDPIEKLNSDDWIAEKREHLTSIYSYDLDRNDEVNITKRESSFTANDRLWSKNALALMKPAQWVEYAPIGDSHLSLHLSLESSIEKQTCFTRLIRLFKCCK